MKSTFIVMAASALIAVPLYAQEVDVTGSSPSAPASPADNAFEVMPWIGLGAGWRGIWIDRDVGGTDSRHGIDLVRLTAGVDYRLNSQSASRRFSCRSLSKAVSAECTAPTYTVGSPRASRAASSCSARRSAGAAGHPPLY